MRPDTVVIGSGHGGLVAAVALARAGQKVLVLEQHYLPGGWCHSFTLEGYKFSPGVHYMGELGVPGQGIRAMYEQLDLWKHLEFLELNPDGFDHLLIGEHRFDHPRGLDRWKAYLVDRFPAEREGLEKYFSVIVNVVADIKRMGPKLHVGDVLAAPFRLPTLLRWGFRTLEALLDECISSPLLRAVLTTRAGNHGLPPSRVALPVHAMMMTHYYEGAWYPRGGARTLPAACIRELRRHGGDIRVRARVRRVLVESGRVWGVELEGDERIECEQVVCNADPALLYGRLLEPRWCQRELKKLQKTEYSVSALSAFCATDLDLRAHGYDSGNYWWFAHHDVAGAYERALTKLPEDGVEALFLTIPTLKDPGSRSDGQHTLEMFAFVPYSPFEGLARDAAYAELKRKYSRMMLAAAERVVPGLSRHLKFFELGTPLTNDFYCETWRGAVYGTAKTFRQVGPFGFSQRGPVEGLYLCGASTVGHGVGGVAFSGMLAAEQVLADVGAPVHYFAKAA